MTSSTFVPDYIRLIENPDIKTVFVTGCGGGFDFIHSMTLHSELLRMGKKVVFGSFSFGDPSDIKGGKEFWRGTRGESTSSSSPAFEVTAVLCDATCKGSDHYEPEVGLCSFLDTEFPVNAPHSCYAYSARSFTVPLLKSLYGKIFTEHEVDAIVMFDGGSDSLMVGSEAGLGDPIEDAVSIAAAATIDFPRLKERIVIAVGLGCDRFNQVSDAATLRAIGELTAVRGFLGCASLHAGTQPHTIYKKCIEHLQGRANFRSVIANSIVASGEGGSGFNVPEELRRRIPHGTLYLWPLMCMHWAFSITAVYNRSLLAPLLLESPSIDEMYTVLRQLRSRLHKEGKLQKVELLPSPAT